MKIVWPDFDGVDSLIGDHDLDWLTRLLYHPVYKHFYRRRYEEPYRLLAEESLLGQGSKAGRILEVGYGAGFFLPVLSRLYDDVRAIDLHDSAEKVRCFLETKLGFAGAELQKGDIGRIPYPDAFFDAVIAVSVLEHVHDLEQGIIEVRRVLKPGGVLVFGVPTRNLSARLLFRLVGFDHETFHPNDDHAVLKCALRHLTKEVVVATPRLLPLSQRLYVSARFRRTP